MFGKDSDVVEKDEDGRKSLRRSKSIALPPSRIGLNFLEETFLFVCVEGKSY